jgi:hypothetical protein
MPRPKVHFQIHAQASMPTKPPNDCVSRARVQRDDLMQGCLNSTQYRSASDGFVGDDRHD